MSTVSIDSDDKKVRYEMNYFILHTFFLVVILSFIIAVIYYDFEKHRSKQRDIDTLTI